MSDLINQISDVAKSDVIFNKSEVMFRVFIIRDVLFNKMDIVFSKSDVIFIISDVVFIKSEVVFSFSVFLLLYFLSVNILMSQIIPLIVFCVGESKGSTVL